MDSQPSRKWMYLSIILAIVVITSSGFSIYTYININTQLSKLQSRLLELQSQLYDLQQESNSIQQQAGQTYLNKSGNMRLQQIFNSIKNSVVLINIITETEEAQGSGFVYNNQGYIITNNHVVEGATSIKVTFIWGNVTKATLVGTDPYSDLAVIKINVPSKELYAVILGNSSNLAVGEAIAAIGNPFGLSDTITSGIVSQIGRELSAPNNYMIVDVIQVDAAINPGNSGGPLVNMMGEVVGVNTAIITDSGMFAGIGFAIPSDTVKREVSSLISTGKYSHPWLGVSGVDVDPSIAEAIGLNYTRGFLIASVVKGSPVEKAGLMGGNRTVEIDGQNVRLGGDVIIGIDSLPVRTLNDVSVYMERNKRPGDTMTLTIIRNGQKMIKQLIVGERPLP